MNVSASHGVRSRLRVGGVSGDGGDESEYGEAADDDEVEGARCCKPEISELICGVWENLISFVSSKIFSIALRLMDSIAYAW